MAVDYFAVLKMYAHCFRDESIRLRPGDNIVEQTFAGNPYIAMTRAQFVSELIRFFGKRKISLADMISGVQSLRTRSASDLQRLRPNEVISLCVNHLMTLIQRLDNLWPERLVRVANAFWDEEFSYQEQEEEYELYRDEDYDNEVDPNNFIEIQINYFIDSWLGNE